MPTIRTVRPFFVMRAAQDELVTESRSVLSEDLGDLLIENFSSDNTQPRSSRERRSRFVFLVVALICTFASPRFTHAQASLSDSARGVVELATEVAQRGDPESLHVAASLLRSAMRLYEDAGMPLDRAKTELRLGVLHLERGEPAEAVSAFHGALTGFRSLNQRVEEGIALGNLGQAYGVIRPDSAVDYHHQAIEIWRDLADSVRLQTEESRLAGYYRARQEWDPAITHTAAALTLAQGRKDHRGAVELNIQLAFLLDAIGQRDSALATAWMAHQLAGATGDTAGLAGSLRLIGISYVRKSEYGRALLHLQEGLTLARTAGDSGLVLRTLTPISAVHFYLGRVDSAHIYTSRNVQLARSLGLEDEEAKALNNLARYEIELGQRTMNQAWFDSSLVHLNAAYAIRGRIPESDAARTTLSNIGFSYLAQGNLDSAEVYFTRTLELARGTNRPGPLGDAFRDLGNLYLQSGRSAEAIDAFRGALMNDRTAGNPWGEAGSLSGIAEALVSRGSREDRLTALAYYDSSVVFLDSIRRMAGGDPNQVDLSDSNSGLAADWVHVWLTLAEQRAVSPQNAMYASLAAVERVRSQGLLNLMGAAPQQPRRDLISEGRSIVQEASRGERSFVSYLLMSDTLVVWAGGGQSGLSVTRVPVAKDSIAALVLSVRRDLAPSEDLEQCISTGPGDPARAVHRLEILAQILFPETVRRHLGAGKVLLIVPDGVLNLLPFAAIPLHGRSTLGEMHALQIGPSLNTVSYLERGSDLPQNADGWRNALIVGNPEMPTIEACGAKAQLVNLPGAGAFSRDLALQLGSNFLTGRAATEDSVQALLPTAPLIQFATHGYAYPSAARARESWIALAPSEADDGLFTVNEIVSGGRFAAELIVLAACNTGLGDVRDAEGTVGLQRALLGRGARSVLVSLWPVNEEPTVELLRVFYREWLHGSDHPTKSEALRRAQLEVKQRFPDARNWAGFQLIGAN